jgi:tetratricopeptide (TPR) repeat protein
MKSRTKNRLWYIAIPLLLALVMVWSAGTGFIFAQETQKMSQKEFHMFTRAKKQHYAGQQLYLKGKYKKAEKAFHKCLELFPRFSSAYYYLAKIHYQRGEYKEARTNIELAKTHYAFMNQLNVSAQMEYLNTLRRQKDQLMADLTNSELRLTGNQRAEMEKNVRKIESILNKPIASVEKIPADYHYVQGNIFFKTKQLKNAHDQYVKAIDTDNTHQNAYNNLISLYLMIKRYQNALDYIKKAEANKVEINPKLKKAVMKAAKK